MAGKNARIFVLDCIILAVALLSAAVLTALSLSPASPYDFARGWLLPAAAVASLVFIALFLSILLSGPLSYTSARLANVALIAADLMLIAEGLCLAFVLPPRHEGLFMIHTLFISVRFFFSLFGFGAVHGANDRFGRCIIPYPE